MYKSLLNFLSVMLIIVSMPIQANLDCTDEISETKKMVEHHCDKTTASETENENCLDHNCSMPCCRIILSEVSSFNKSFEQSYIVTSIYPALKVGKIKNYQNLLDRPPKLFINI